MLAWSVRISPFIALTCGWWPKKGLRLYYTTSCFCVGVLVNFALLGVIIPLNCEMSVAENTDHITLSACLYLGV